MGSDSLYVNPYFAKPTQIPEYVPYERTDALSTGFPLPIVPDPVYVPPTKTSSKSSSSSSSADKKDKDKESDSYDEIAKRYEKESKEYAKREELENARAGLPYKKTKKALKEIKKDIKIQRKNTKVKNDGSSHVDTGTKGIARWLANGVSAVGNVLSGLTGCEADEESPLGFSCKKPQNLLFSTLAIAGTAALCCIPVVGPVIGYGLLAAGVVGGACGTIKGIDKLKKAEKSGDQRKIDEAQQDIITGGITTALSVCGLKHAGAAARSAALANGTKASVATARATRIGKAWQSISQFGRDVTVNATKTAVNVDRNIVAMEGGYWNAFKFKSPRMSHSEKYEHTMKHFKNNMNSRMESLNQEIAEIDAKINSTRGAEQASLLKRRWSLNQRREILSKNIERFDKINTNVSKVDLLKGKKARINKEIKSLEDRISKIKDSKQKTKLTAKKNKLESDINDLKNKPSLTDPEKADLANLETELKSVNKQINRLPEVKQKRRLTVEKTKLENEFNNVEKEIKVLSKPKNIDDLNTRKSDLEAKIQKLKSQIRKEKAKKDPDRAKIQKKEAELERKNKDLKSCEEEIKILTENQEGLTEMRSKEALEDFVNEESEGMSHIQNLLNQEAEDGYIVIREGGKIARKIKIGSKEHAAFKKELSELMKLQEQYEQGLISLSEKKACMMREYARNPKKYHKLLEEYVGKQEEGSMWNPKNWRTNPYEQAIGGSNPSGTRQFLNLTAKSAMPEILYHGLIDPDYSDAFMMTYDLDADATTQRLNDFNATEEKINKLLSTIETTPDMAKMYEALNEAGQIMSAYEAAKNPQPPSEDSSKADEKPKDDKSKENDTKEDKS